MMEKILNRKDIKYLVVILIYFLFIYKLEINVFDTYSWVLFLFMIMGCQKLTLYQKHYFSMSVLLSIIFSVLLVYGSAAKRVLFEKTLTLSSVFFTVPKFIMILLTFIMFYSLLINIFSILDKLTLFERRKEVTSKKIWVGVSIFSIVARIPYFLALYPGVLTPDSIYEYNMITGISKTLSNHHPLIHVLFTYLPYKLGMILFHNVNAAVATATFTQIVVTSIIIGYIIQFLYKKGVKKFYIILVFLFYTLLPLHSYYSVTVWKDVMFSYILVLLLLKIYDLYTKYFNREDLTKKDMISFVLISIIFVLFRNNAIYAYAFFGVIMVLCFHKQKKLMISSLLIVIGVYLIIMIPIYNMMGVKRSSSSEYIAIPLQQIGRMTYKNTKFTKKEKKQISKLLPIKTMEESYIPQNVDKLKFHKEFQQDEFDKNKMEYLQLWMSLVLKHPDTAVESYSISTLGYWYPSLQEWNTERGVYKNKSGIKHTPLGIKEVNNVLLKGDNLFQKIGIINIFLSVGAGFWISLVLMTYSMKKRKERILFFAPLIGIWITMMIASPTYGEFRYIYSVYLALPILFLVPFIKTEKRVEQIQMEKSNLMMQILKFGVVGGTAFVIDYGVLIFCKEFLHFNTIISTFLGFTISVIYNYIASVKWVFDVNKENSKKKNFILFIVFSIIGLILTEVIMFTGADLLKFEYKLVKIFATAIVMVFNFVTRKIFLE